MNRLYLALAAYAGLALLSWKTIGEQKIKLVTLAILAMFAVKTLLHRKDTMHSEEEDRESTNGPM